MIRRALPALLSLGMLAACAATPGGPQVPDAPVQNTLWKLQRLAAEPATAPAARQPQADLLLHVDGNRSTGSGGCNRYTGTYTLKGKSLTFGTQGSTRMACVSGMDREQQFMGTLSRTAGWRIKGDHLWLLDSAGKTLAEFDALYLR
jgi:hypothetical protein